MPRPISCGYRSGMSVAVATIVALSAAINILSLAGAIYMLQVYDRVLTSQSIPTLVVLSVLLTTAYLSLGLLETLRAQLMSRIGARLDANLAVPAFGAVLSSGSAGGRAVADNQPLRDLEVLRGFLQGSAPIALIDLPWVPVFLIFVAVLDATLGFVTLAALVLVFIVGRLAQRAANHFENATANAIGHRRMLADSAANCSDIVKTMGLGPVLAERRYQDEIESSRSIQRAGDRTAWVNSLAKILRLSVHSALIGVGAYVALKGDLNLGAIVAATIAAGRALAPVELATAHGHNTLNARAAWRRLRAMSTTTSPTATAALTREGGLTIQDLAHVIPGQSQPVLRAVSFTLLPGQALAVIGKSGAGKTVLAEALVGLRAPTVGSVRLAGTPVGQLSDVERRCCIGYAPQREQWLPGDIADTITGFALNELRNRAIGPAKAIGIHLAITQLQRGYATPVEDALTTLSQGQRRQLTLARAFHGTPRLIVLDDPFADLDADGEIALNQAIMAACQRGAIVIATSKRRLAKSVFSHVAIINGSTLKPVSPPATTESAPPIDERANSQSASVVTLPRRKS